MERTVIYADSGIIMRLVEGSPPVRGRITDQGFVRCPELSVEVFPAV